ncbi:hypothetical protein SANA_28720 [Gottschalkiaceae bacterium SANA]|nr:hypothetical protein SANA_28720 [Gottschalkiaceae bacterium SANA]
MRIVTCTGYYGTGSSAIGDFISEFDKCYYLTNYEFRFIQDPEGISDLEYNLIENHHRHNSGHALKRYQKKVDFLSGNRWIPKYEAFFQNRWKEISYDYINDLTEFTYGGYWHQDVIDGGKAFYIRKRMWNKVLQKTLWRKQVERGLNEMPNEVTLCSRPSQEDFLLKTRAYTKRLFECANMENKPDLMVEQIVPPSNIDRYCRYFDDLKVFVVERDPRDLYLLEKYIWHGRVIPTASVDVFCQWYLYTRSHRKSETFDKSHTMFIQFEDLIYQYEKTSKEIMAWLGYSEKDHCHKKMHFIPEQSINNTKLWEQIPGVEEELAVIEDKLKAYLYTHHA